MAKGKFSIDWRQLRARLAWTSLPLCFAGLFLFDGALRYFYRSAGSTRFLDWRAFLFTGAWALLLTAVCGLLPTLARRIFMGIYALFFGLLTVLHGVMFNIFGKFFSFSDTTYTVQPIFSPTTARRISLVTKISSSYVNLKLPNF